MESWRLSPFLLPFVQLLAGLAAPGAAAIARWPALDFKSDRAFYPLMVSFSRYPFHDVYETVATIPAPKPAASLSHLAAPGGASQLAKARKSFGYQRDWRQQQQQQQQQQHSRPVKMPTKSICQGLIYLPQALHSSGRRIPPKMRKLLKYCGFI